MKTFKRRKVIHRSFSIDEELVRQARRVVPEEVADNLNRLVTVALNELVMKYKRLEFDNQIAEMAADPALVRESKKAAADFEFTDADGL
ncbi:MAG: hypothetical protein HY922_10730 [Elusimicrobia bacterium]|nr:hypothetical protein [Elusimicrobiota bacterium]